jgi:hypothetical protein
MEALARSLPNVSPQCRTATARESYPYSQAEVVREVNVRLAGAHSINSRDILSIRRAYSIQSNIRFCWRESYAMPRYTFSQEFVDWILAEVARDPGFLQKAAKSSPLASVCTSELAAG